MQRTESENVMSQSEKTPVLHDAVHAELEDWGRWRRPRITWMATHGRELWADGPRRGGSGSAHCPSRWLLETHEVIYLVAGRMTVTRTTATQRDRRR